jgi:hypothetical protein
MTQYNKIKNPASGYFSPDGTPYHSVETLIAEAPDYGHETTSEAFSFWVWLEAEFGRVTGNWQPLANAWAKMEQVIIPAQADQPTNSGYNASSPATYAPESDLITNYPAQLMFGAPVGSDPIAGELQSAYGSPNIYGMHWLLDVDNFYGYGNHGDGVSKPSYINTFQRGPSESVWKTVPQPSWENFRWGRTSPATGFLSLFTIDPNPAQQWRYTDAPDADARAIQAIYWAKVFADQQGGSPIVNGLVAKASKMGDYLRYGMFDKYFKQIGNCVGESNCANGSGKSSMHLLLAWYYAWGGAAAPGQNWAWRIGASHCHQGYQNLVAAFTLSQIPAFKPISATGAADWSNALGRQLEFYQWLQSAEGAIAGGATNSWQGSYAQPPAGQSTFHGMFFDPQPVFHDPPSNRWFGFQAWSMERVAEYYFITDDPKAKALLDKWVGWAESQTTLTSDGSYSIPSDLDWTGQPDVWNPSSPGSNSGLHVSVMNFTSDVGVTAAYAKLLMYYAAKSGDLNSKNLAKELLDRMWNKFQDNLGVAIPETRTDYLQFGDSVFIPQGWTGANAQGGVLDQTTTFISMRPKYLQDPAFSKVQAYLNGGPAPTFTYHRFWAQSDVAMAMADWARLFPQN